MSYARAHASKPAAPAFAFLLPPLLVATVLHGATASPVAALVEGPNPERIPLVGPLKADRGDVPLVRATALLDQKLRQLARTGTLQDLPDSFVMELRIDASGAITALAFEPPCGTPGKLLEAQLLGWRMEAWTVTGQTVLRVPVRMMR